MFLARQYPSTKLTIARADVFAWFFTPSKKYTWLLTETAETDIDDALSYIAEVLHNPEAASAFADKLENSLDTLCKAPKNGHLVENEYLRRDDVRRILVDNYIAYSPRDS